MIFLRLLSDAKVVHGPPSLVVNQLSAIYFLCGARDKTLNSLQKNCPSELCPQPLPVIINTRTVDQTQGRTHVGKHFPTVLQPA